MFSKILIANRGEIACRVVRTCRRLGIRTVAVYSEADSQARHVRLADEAICIGPAPSRESYLRADRIIEAARDTGAQAIHPGYGFLSENEGFADACAKAGIVFIGPPVAAIHAMASKSAAKALMDAAGVPLVPGYHGDDQALDRLLAEAAKIGFPVLIKAAAGGGGKGMRVVERHEHFEAALMSCQREASASFGNSHVLVEKYIQRPRHVEIQVFGDSHGNMIHLHERDCSTQRRHQKVVEEAPAPGMTVQRRKAMGEAACDAARTVGYVGAGTVEFIVDQDDAFYFMEMNTRLQVEHPVTEMTTGLDLVEWQLRVASGEALPLQQGDVPLRGHAIEVRIYAEEPEKGFLPSVGTLAYYAPPEDSPHVRVDTGVEQGDAISPHYDPMIAKLIVHDETRERAIQRMLLALGEFRIAGVGNNIAFLSRLVGHDTFRKGHVDTDLIAREGEALLQGPSAAPESALVAAALRMLADTARHQRGRAHHSPDPHSPWADSDGWRMGGTFERHFTFRHADETRTLAIAFTNGSLAIDGNAIRYRLPDAHAIRYEVGGHVEEAVVVSTNDKLHVFGAEGAFTFEYVDPLEHASQDQQAEGGVVAPMPGKVVALLVESGSEVDKETPLLVMEAMKMEYTLSAPSRGKLVEYLFAVGDQVQEGATLVDFKADA